MPSSFPRITRPARGRRLVLAAVLAALGLTVLAGPASAEPSAEQLREQQQRAEHLSALADERAVVTLGARERLSLLSARANVALDAYVTARRAADAARAHEMDALAHLEQARQVVASERAALGRLASSAYRNGGSLEGLALLASLLDSASVTDIGRAAADVRWAGTQQSNSVDRFEQAQALAAAASQEAYEAGQAASAAAARAEAAKRRADRLVAEQRAAVAELEELAARTAQAAAQARREASQMAKARRIAAERLAAAERARLAALAGGQVQVPVGACRGGDLVGYANGELPVAALCPLWGTGGQVLRADAAAAFNAMSKAYARHFGRPILVTDSYRTYEMQVACREAKGSLCADPGTSNHGWGTAVDLGDGIERFGTTTHRWMSENAPRFGWFHPSWAEPGGSKPEPWHWEFGG